MGWKSWPPITARRVAARIGAALRRAGAIHRDGPQSASHNEPEGSCSRSPDTPGCPGPDPCSCRRSWLPLSAESQLVGRRLSRCRLRGVGHGGLFGGCRRRSGVRCRLGRCHIGPALFKRDIHVKLPQHVHADGEIGDAFEVPACPQSRMPADGRGHAVILDQHRHILRRHAAIGEDKLREGVSIRPAYAVHLRGRLPQATMSGVSGFSPIERSAMSAAHDRARGACIQFGIDDMTLDGHLHPQPAIRRHAHRYDRDIVARRHRSGCAV